MANPLNTLTCRRVSVPHAMWPRTCLTNGSRSSTSRNKVHMHFAVYYKLINDRGQTDPWNNPLYPGDMNAYPPGFQVKAGSPDRQEKDYNVQHKCMGPNTNTVEFPPTPEDCWALRAEITFPSCWNGKNGSEGDHMSHMSYPRGGNWMAGPCPSSHPERLPTLFFEAIFLTGKIFEAGDELVYSYNDKIGYGFHGDSDYS